jgi:GNAT superfamily N-acetyltransferase
MKIRPAREDELGALSELCLRSKALWGYDRDFMERCRAVLTLHPEELRTSRVMVAEREGVVMGVVQLMLLEDRAELYKLFVEPEVNGEGIGSALYAWAAETAKAEGAACLMIEADPDAVPFYRSRGARAEGSVASEVQPDRRLPLLRHRL